MVHRNGIQISRVKLTVKKSILSTTLSLLSMPALSATLDVSGYDKIISDSNTYSNGHLKVGITSDGTLTVNNGAVLNTRYGNTIWTLSVGGQAGVTGVLTLTGEGTTLIDSNISHIGSKGNGYLNVINGATASLDVISLGSSYGGYGQLLVDGTGSSVSSISYISVGSSGKGNLTITNGGEVNIGASVYIGHGGVVGDPNSPDVEGTVFVSGQDSTLTAENGIFVGTFGSGAMVVNDGGQVISKAGIIAYDTATKSSEAIITGTNSSWQVEETLTIGRLGTGTLTVADNATVSAGNIIIADRNSANGQLIIGSAVGEAATSAGHIIADTIAFGSGQGNITFNHNTDNYQFVAAISGNGTVDIYNGTTVLTGLNTYSGTTTLHGGILKAGADNALSANSDYEIKNNATLDLQGYDQTIASLTNAGSVIINGAPGTSLTITGDYIGDNGTISFNNILTDDSSVTDKLIIQGDTSGTTQVIVNNLGGTGDQTLNGVELIQVNGSNSDGEFVQSGRIVAGAYDYTLSRGDGSNANNWYLNSTASPFTDERVNRPEAGSYTANLAAANTLFAMRLHDRFGETYYTDMITGEQKTTTMWLRNEGGHNRFHDKTGQLKTKSNRYVVQLGADIAQWNSNALDSGHIGFMAGYGRNSSTSYSHVSGHDSKGVVEGYSLGLYSTWFADKVDKLGFYVDGWAYHSWFDNTVKGQDLVSENYKSKGITASLEGGYTSKLGDSYFIQPKAQVTHMGVKANNHKESNGTNVFGNGNGNIQTRLGLKVFMNNEDKESQLMQGFIEANWLHNSKAFSTTMDDVTITQANTNNIGEIKVGVESRLGHNGTIWGNIAQQQGNKNYRDSAITLGMKYSF